MCDSVTQITTLADSICVCKAQQLMTESYCNSRSHLFCLRTIKRVMITKSPVIINPSHIVALFPLKCKTCILLLQGSCSSTSTEFGFFESVSVAGELELALAFNTNASRLEITVGACRNLSYGDSKRRKCHPYVKLYVLPDKSSKLKTSVKRNTTDPVYNEVLKYNIERHMLTGKRLQVTVWHSGTLKRKVFLGEVLIPLDGWRFEDKAFERFNWYPLCAACENHYFKRKSSTILRKGWLRSRNKNKIN
uniref:C2 domain-containing protein n=1 Tax=Amphilophus citrinellus TaxID=61819 RepID=A0A3Q0S4F9_AMPCI